ncbi:MAG TPA: L,D-transpeptidase [Acidimicrobiia bacterium]
MAVRRTLTVAVSLATLTLGVAACGGAGGSRADDPSPDHRSSPASTAPAPAAPAAAHTVARATGAEVAVYADPDAPVPERHLPGTTEFGFRRSFLVLDEQGDALEVLLPIRPNGSTGWIRRADVELQPVDHEIDVDLEARTLTLRAGGDVVLETPAAIGAPDAATPTGRFFVTDLLDTGDPDHDYGPFAAGLSGYSNFISEFAGGDGQIGIHGTNDPASIGEAVSHGCVRVPNDVITTLATTVPIGTPVTIH